MLSLFSKRMFRDLLMDLRNSTLFLSSVPSSPTKQMSGISASSYYNYFATNVYCLDYVYDVLNEFTT